jgi:hypothetical protein
VSPAFLLAALTAFAFDGGDVPDGGAADGGGVDGAPAASDAAATDVGDAGPTEVAEVGPMPARLLVKLAGKVQARGTRQPLAGALVHAGVGDGTTVEVETGADGAFSLEVLPGAHKLRVQCPGYAPLTWPVTVAADVTDLVVRLEPRATGERYETVVTSEPRPEPVIPLRREELVRTAGSLGDPMRVIESLPGVVQSTWPLPFYAIRGANPGNTGFFIDGVRAPALFHFALGPSVLHPFFIEEVEFYPGGYPIHYGRYASGIVAAKTTTPATDRLHVSADVRLFDAGGIAAMPWDDGKGTVAVAGRYSYTGYLLSRFSSAYSLDYWDYQLRVDHTLGPGKLSLFAFGSGDTLRQKQPDDTDWGFVNQPVLITPGVAKLTFHRAQLRWDGQVAKGRFTAAVVGGIDDSTVSITSLFSLPVGTRMLTLAPRVAERWSVRRWLDVEIGADAELQRARPTSLVALTGGFLAENYETDLFHDRTIVSAGAYLGLTLRVSDRLTLGPGLRYDGYFEQGVERFAPSPRLQARVRLGARDFLKATVGQFSQMPSLPVGVPGFESFGLATYGLQRSRQASVGFESALAERLGIDVNLDTTLFYQRLQLTDLRNSLIPDPQTPDLLEPRQGESYGLEVMLRRPMKHKLYGWLAYTLSRSQRVVDGIIVPSDWDQRHIVNLVVGYRWPRNYSTSVRFHYNSGRPYPVYNERTRDVDGYIRLPGFPQLDLRADKRFVFDSFVLDAYVELVNATLSREVFDVKRQASGTLTEKYYRLVLPSVGVHVEF